MPSLIFILMVFFSDFGIANPQNKLKLIQGEGQSNPASKTSSTPKLKVVPKKLSLPPEEKVDPFSEQKELTFIENYTYRRPHATFDDSHYPWLQVLNHYDELTENGKSRVKALLEGPNFYIHLEKVLILKPELYSAIAPNLPIFLDLSLENTLQKVAQEIWNKEQGSQSLVSFFNKVNETAEQKQIRENIKKKEVQKLYLHLKNSHPDFINYHQKQKNSVIALVKNLIAQSQELDEKEFLSKHYKVVTENIPFIINEYTDLLKEFDLLNQLKTLIKFDIFHTRKSHLLKTLSRHVTWNTSEQEKIMKFAEANPDEFSVKEAVLKSISSFAPPLSHEIHSSIQNFMESLDNFNGRRDAYFKFNEADQIKRVEAILEKPTYDKKTIVSLKEQTVSNTPTACPPKFNSLIRLAKSRLANLLSQPK